MAYDVAGDPRLDPRLKGLLAMSPQLPVNDVADREEMLAEAGSEHMQQMAVMLKGLMEMCDTDSVAPSAGLTEVDGPAVVVTLDDAKQGSAQLPDGVTPDDLVVHQQDVQAVVNALWRGGAEAMMIQDQRVIATSAVRCVGNTLILQGRVYSPPFVIKAMGKIDALKAALDADPKVEIYRQYVDAIGLGYDVKVITKTRFPAFTGAIGLSQAVVAR